MRSTLPVVITNTMTREIIEEAIRREGTVQNLDANGLEQVKQMEQSEIDELGGRIISVAHYIWRTSPTALKLVLDDRVRGHLNVFTRMELAGLKPFIRWGGLVVSLFEPIGVNFNHACFTSDFGPQLKWLNEVDFLFPEALAVFYFRKRREFMEINGIVGKRDLYEYVRLPESEVFGFGKMVKDEDSSLTLERQNINQAMYGDISENMVFRTTRDIVSANGGGSPIDW